MNRIILICATIFVFVIGVGCASAADLNVAGDVPALDVEDSVSIVKDDEISTAHVEPDVQKSASLEHSGKAADYKDRPIIEFQDHDFSASLRPDVQKVSLSGKYPDLEKEQNRPIASFWDHVFPFDNIKNMTDCEE